MSYPVFTPGDKNETPPSQHCLHMRKLNSDLDYLITLDANIASFRMPSVM